MEGCQNTTRKTAHRTPIEMKVGIPAYGLRGWAPRRRRSAPSPAPRLLDILCNMSGESEHNYKRSSVRIRKLWKSREVIINSHSREAEDLAGGPFISGTYLFCRGRRALTPWCCQSDPFSLIPKFSVAGKIQREWIRVVSWTSFLLCPSISV